jgi:dipeptidyl aminopeptidase/acylaminoacyl peptidase
LDARRLLDWLVTHPEIDPDRIASAGVSTGGILALTLMEVDPRIRAGFFLMVGGNLAEILHDSRERPVRAFRERLQTEQNLETREAFVSYLEPYLRAVDPITYAARIDPRTVLLASGRFDRVVHPRHTRALWQALGKPTWIHLPAGHYQMFPFFWWSIGRGAKHLDRLFAEP